MPFMSTGPPPAPSDEVPSYQKLMLPLLRYAADGNIHTTTEALEPIATLLSLSEVAKKATLPDGRNKLRHRLEWARTYLKKATLLEYPRRGAFVITTNGRDLLKETLTEINNAILSRYPEFVAFKTSHSDETSAVISTATSDEEIDPEEAFENAHLALRKSLESDLLDRVKKAPPEFLEQLVIDLLVAMGYGGSKKDAGKALGRTGDGGIDGLVKEDTLGLDAVYVQAKRYAENTVGRPALQQFAGALQEHRAKKGVFITTSAFSKEARDFVTRADARIVLIDGPTLAALMADYNVGVATGKEYVVKTVDADYFAEE
jgi:restriction system protein